MAYTVSQLLFDILPRVGDKPPTGITVIGAANSVTNIIYKRLLKRNSDLLATGRLSMLVPAGRYSLTLPDDYLSPAEKPYAISVDGAVASIQSQLVTAGLLQAGQDLITALFASGSGVAVSAIQAIVDAQPLVANVQTMIDTLITTSNYQQLEPNYLNDDNRDDLGWWDWYGMTPDPATPTASVPSSMKIINDTMFVRPKCTADVTIRGRYNQIPAKLIATTDILPFRSFFDEVYREGLVFILLGGTSMADADQAFEAFILREVDTILNSRVHLVKSEGRVARRNWT